MQLFCLTYTSLHFERIYQFTTTHADGEAFAELQGAATQSKNTDLLAISFLLHITLCDGARIVEVEKTSSIHVLP
jgi:hypothetical protein